MFPLILGLALIAQAAPLSVSELLTNPDRFHGQPVTISGTMLNLRESVSRRGTRRYTFDLGDGNQTVYVIQFEKPPHQSVLQRWRALLKGNHGRNVRCLSSRHTEEDTRWCHSHARSVCSSRSFCSARL